MEDPLFIKQELDVEENISDPNIKKPVETVYIKQEIDDEDNNLTNRKRKHSSDSDKVDSEENAFHCLTIKKEKDSDSEESENQNILHHRLKIKKENENEDLPDAKCEIEIEEHPLKNEDDYSSPDGSTSRNDMLCSGQLEVTPEITEGGSTSETGPNTVPVPKKRAKRNHLKLEEKNNIINVYKSELLANSGLAKEDVVKKLSVKTGAGRTAIYRILREQKVNKALSAPKTNKARPMHVIDSINNTKKELIRQKVHEFYFQNQYPTIDKVLVVVNEDDTLPDFKRTSFYKLMKILNFVTHKYGRHTLLVDREEIIIQRREYLTKIKSLRNEGKTVYYLGETWINAGHTSFNGSKNTSKGKLVIGHIGSEKGFVSDALWTYESKNRDNSLPIDGKSFEKWLSKILPKLDESAVIVLDEAPHHSRLTEAIPSSETTKEDLRSWLSSKQIPFQDDMIRLELLDIVEAHRQRYTKYAVDELAKTRGITVLRLPPFHAELNPIQLIWSDIKNYVYLRDAPKMSDTRRLFEEALETVTKETWFDFVQHVKENVEMQMWELDNRIETHIETILNKDSTDSDDNSFSS